MLVIRAGAIQLPGRQVSAEEYARVAPEPDADFARLYRHYGLDPAHRRFAPPPATLLSPIPVADGSVADLAVAVSQQLLAKGEPEPDMLIYCHTSLDADVASSPACRLQYELQRKGLTPFAVAQAGGVAPALALELLADCFAAEPVRHALLLCADQVVAPFERCFFDTFPQGDGAVGLSLAAEGAGATVLSVAAVTRGQTGDANTWSERRYAAHGRRLLRAAAAAAEAALGSGPRGNTQLTAQTLAPWFSKGLSQRLGLPLWRRQSFPAVNLQTGDVFFSLTEWLQGSPAPGDRLLLVPAGPLCSAAAILVEFRP
jgi:3-oxoacyl-[acyl-carrier-protein] synthase III